MSRCTYMTKGAPVGGIDLVCGAAGEWHGDVGGGVHTVRCEAHVPAWVKSGRGHGSRLKVAQGIAWTVAIVACSGWALLVGWIMGVL